MIAAAASTAMNTGALVRAAWWWRHAATGAGVGQRTWRQSWQVPGSGMETGRVVFREVPRLSHYMVGPRGWSARVKLRPGQTVELLVNAGEAFRQAFRADVVRIVPERPGYARLVVVRADPLRGASPFEPLALDDTRLRLALVDSGQPWVWNLRLVPHMLVTGATGSGKSTFLGGVFTALAPTAAAIVGLDLKHGIEQSLWSPRLTDLAETPQDASRALDRVLDVMARRAGVLKAHALLSVYDLPHGHPARRPIVVVIDELAELLVLAGPADPLKNVKQALAVQVLRVAQLGRAFGVHLVVAAQRFASDIAPAVTAIRSQLGARVVFRCSDAETVRMALADAAPDALSACLAITPDQPGTAVVSGGPLGWDRVRGLLPPSVAETARVNAALAPSWPELADLGDVLPIRLADVA